jgi:mono/diheme cytochrome c family protein
MKRWPILLLLSFSTLFAVGAARDGNTAPAPSLPPAKSLVGNVAAEKEMNRVEGEQRFRTNCGRCHQAPHKFPARMMGTIVRHMRVRAMLTEDDMTLILAYMTE